MTLELAFVLLFCASTAVAIGAHRLRIPYTVALLAAGILLGAGHLFEPPALTRDLLFALFLPGLVFEAAFHLDMQRFWQNKVPILGLAVPGVIGSLLLIAEIVSRAPPPVATGLAFGEALVFASLIVATDPVAVLGIFRSLSAPERLSAIVSGESLFNDGTGVALFGLALSIAGGSSPSLLTLAGRFVAIFAGGAGIGAAVGILVWRITRRLDDPMIEVTLTVIAGYGSFGLAEQLGASGVIAAAVSGLLCGNLAAERGMSEATRNAANAFWDYVVFALNSLIFLLMGLHIELRQLASDWAAIGMAWAAVTIARAIVLYSSTGLLRLTSHRVPWSWSLVATWSGMRGALAMTLALSLPAWLPGRVRIIHMTFGVVVLTILIQGLTLSALLRAFGLGRSAAPGA